MDYALILSKKYAGEEWTLDGDDYAGLTWLSDSPKPTKATLDKLWESTQADIVAEQESKATAKAALLERLGITADEAALLLG